MSGKKVLNFLKEHVAGPLMTAGGAVVAAVSASGKDAEPKEVALVFVGALLGAVLHKEVIVKFAPVED